eukprot:GHVL01006695.1.p1 GENE.GHVL01006695.1~~GHVL01006695.1.p1  ORF type:complete len:286 (-),score=32.37 GHVL01006695.1:92-949(-)
MKHFWLPLLALCMAMTIIGLASLGIVELSKCGPSTFDINLGFGYLGTSILLALFTFIGATITSCVLSKKQNEQLEQASRVHHHCCFIFWAIIAVPLLLGWGIVGTNLPLNGICASTIEHHNLLTGIAQISSGGLMMLVLFVWLFTTGMLQTLHSRPPVIQPADETPPPVQSFHTREQETQCTMYPPIEIAEHPPPSPPSPPSTPVIVYVEQPPASIPPRAIPQRAAPAPARPRLVRFLANVSDNLTKTLDGISVAYEQRLQRRRFNEDMRQQYGTQRPADLDSLA